MLNVNSEEPDKEMARRSLKVRQKVQWDIVSDGQYFPSQIRHNKTKSISQWSIELVTLVLEDQLPLLKGVSEFAHGLQGGHKNSVE